MDYTITLTETEKLSLKYITVDVDEWITNAAKDRARKATEQIVRLNTDYCNANSISIAVGVDAQVQQAYDLGVVKSAAEVNAEAAAAGA